MTAILALLLAPIFLIVLTFPAWAVWKFSDALAYRFTRIEAGENSVPAGTVFVFTAFILATTIFWTHPDVLKSAERTDSVLFWIIAYCAVCGAMVAVAGLLSGATFVLRFIFSRLIAFVRGADA